MGRKAKRKFDEETKRKAVEEYTSGKRTAAEVARDLDVAQGQIYQWKIQLEERRVKGRIKDLELSGRSPSDARLIQRQEDEIALYQKKIAELTLINDLLKKLRTEPSSRPVRSASGSDEIGDLLAQSKKPARR